MVLWINLHQNNSFVNRLQLPWLCEKTGVIALALPGLASGRWVYIKYVVLNLEI